MQSLHLTNNTPLMRVEKIGGDDSFQMRATLAMLEKRQASGEQGVYVFSAFKDSVSENGKQWNTTDLLIKIATALSRENMEEMENLFVILSSHYKATLERELSNHRQKDEVIELLEARLDYLEDALTYATETRQKPEKMGDYSLHYMGKSFSLMGFGEMLTSELYSLALGIHHSWIDTYASSPETNIREFRKNIAIKAMSILEDTGIILVPGYSGNIAGGLHTKVGRGYSDWTAAQIYAGLREGYTDANIGFMIRKLYGISSADPRTVEKVKKLTHISYTLLLQMIDTKGADAGFVNRAAAMPEIFRNGGYMKIYSERDESETLVTHDGPENSELGIQFVQDRRVQVINITSYHMNRVGYLAFVADFLAKSGLSIIDDSSDATQINLMIGVDKKVSREMEMERFSAVCETLRLALIEFEDDDSGETLVTHNSDALIFLGGERIDKPGVLAKITALLAEKNINIGPVVQTKNPQVIVLGVPEEIAREAVKILHRELIEV